LKNQKTYYITNTKIQISKKVASVVYKMVFDKQRVLHALVLSCIFKRFEHTPCKQPYRVMCHVLIAVSLIAVLGYLLFIALISLA